MRERSGATVVAHHLLPVFLADLPGQMELEDTYQADVMRLHGVPEPAIAELYAVSKEHRIYGGSVTVDRTIGTATSSRRAAGAFSSGSGPGTARPTRSS